MLSLFSWVVTGLWTGAPTVYVRDFIREWK
jgi:hypothetical protein